MLRNYSIRFRLFFCIMSGKLIAVKAIMAFTDE